MMPTLANPICQRVTGEQFLEPEFAFWKEQLRLPDRIHRKDWEHVYIMQCLSQPHPNWKGKGIGFGVGREPTSKLLTDYGCDVLATDLPSETWVGQNAKTAEDVGPGIAFRHVDMRAIPEDLTQGQFDFCWSACALEHIGGIAAGLEFIRQSLKCLKPGGIAVHTTEYGPHTYNTPGLCIYNDAHIKRFCEEMGVEYTLEAGKTEWDRLVNQNCESPHINVKLDNGWVTTSFGFFIRKPD